MKTMVYIGDSLTEGTDISTGHTLTEKIEVLIGELTRHATESEVVIVDLHRRFLKHRRQVRPDLFLPDGLHPNQAGHLTIAQGVVPVIREVLNFSKNSYPS